MSRRSEAKRFPIGPDVDLDAEDIRLSDGRRLTDELAEQLADEAVTRRRGRPSISGQATSTPNLTVRVPPTTRAALDAIAKAQGRPLADISRDALAEYIERHAS